MKIPIIRELASKHSSKELHGAAAEFETSRHNSLNVTGDDEGEILSNLLMAAVIKEKVEGGLSLSDALREHTKSIQNIIKGSKAGNNSGIF
jgi:hypothetical protein